MAKVENALVFLVVFPAFTGCGEDTYLPDCLFCEHWYVSDETTTSFDGPGRIGVEVTTTPAAWPNHLYGDAVRASFSGSGSLWLVDEENHEILQGADNWVNVLDAWDNCSREEVCIRTFWFDVECEDTCKGEFSVDAFLSTKPFAEPDRGGELVLELVDAVTAP